MEATIIDNSEIMTTKELFYSPILQLSNYSNIKHLYNVSRNYAWYWKYENERQSLWVQGLHRKQGKETRQWWQSAHGSMEQEPLMHCQASRLEGKGEEVVREGIQEAVMQSGFFSFFFKIF